MCDLPATSIRLLRPFAPVFSSRVWPWVTTLLVGAILAPGPRTVAAALRVLGLQDDRRRWLPERDLVAVADSTYAALDLLAACARLPHPVAVITRLRLDAALYDPAPARPPGTRGRPRQKGERQPTLAHRLVDPATAWQALTVRGYGGIPRAIEVATATALWYRSGRPPVALRWVLVRDPADAFAPQALLCTDAAVSAQHSVEWFVLRWQLEVTVHEARAHLGIETQRQWSDRAIQRTTPTLLGLFSLVTLVAHELLPAHDVPVRQAAWYTKALPTFGDALALVRRELWAVPVFSLSPQADDRVEIPRSLWNRMTDALAYAA